MSAKILKPKKADLLFIFYNKLMFLHFNTNENLF